MDNVHPYLTGRICKKQLEEYPFLDLNCYALVWSGLLTLEIP